MDKNQELQQVNALKTIMMFLVVIYHSLLACCRNGWGGINDSLQGRTLINYIAGWLNMLHIEFFTFASGYLFYMLRYEMGRYNTPKEDLKNRFKRLMVPFFVVSIFWAIPAQLLAYGFSWSIILKGFVLQASPAQLWFLPMLFLLYIFFYFCSDYIIEMPIWAFCGGYAVIYVCKIWISNYIPLGVFQISTVIEYSLYYYLGFRLRQNEAWIPSIRKVLCICAIAAATAFGYLVAIEIEDVSIGTFLEIIRPAVCAIQVLAVIGLGKVVKVDRLIDKWWFKQFSINSMGIYLFHQQILYAEMRVFSNMPIAVMSLLYSIIALLGAYAITSAVRRTRLGNIIF